MIEVRHLEIRTTVSQELRPADRQVQHAGDQWRLKQEILLECREMLRELLREQQER